MAWEDRNGRRYYYRKRREGRRVVSEYIGAGVAGELSAMLDAEDRSISRQDRAAWQATKQSADDLATQARRVEKFTKALTRAALMLSGYHAPSREWRKRRD
jgi:hypothetical protein